MQAWPRVLHQRVFGGLREWARLKNDARLRWAYGLILAEMMRTKFKLKVPQ